jgi:hypothetical protein
MSGPSVLDFGPGNMRRSTADSLGAFSRKVAAKDRRDCQRVEAAMGATVSAILFEAKGSK